jgi:hypothetical protein
MAKARQVGCPHFLQFVLGRCLNISTPESAMVRLLSINLKLRILGSWEDAERDWPAFSLFSTS